MHGFGQQSQRAPDGAPLHYEHHRTEQPSLTASPSVPAPDRRC